MTQKQIEMIATGSVSSGTMLARDLVPTFLEELEGRNKKLYDKIVTDQDFAAFFAEYNSEYFDNSEYLADVLYDSEVVGWLLEELFDALNECASEGHYFGAHPGDGADYGFWQYDGPS